MTQNDCFVFYIIATMLDGTTKVHSFKHLIGTKCSYKYVNMMGELVDLSNFTERTIHLESSLDPTSGNVIHETTQLSPCQGLYIGQDCNEWRPLKGKVCSDAYEYNGIGLGRSCTPYHGSGGGCTDVGGILCKCKLELCGLP